MPVRLRSIAAWAVLAASSGVVQALSPAGSGSASAIEDACLHTVRDPSALLLVLADDRTSGAPTKKSRVTRAGDADDSLVTPAIAKAVDRALEFLAKQQEEASGGFGPFGTSQKGQPRIAVSALATLAFLAHGEIPGRTPYGRNVERGVDYLIVRNQTHPRYDKGGEKIGNYFTEEYDDISRMHGHGYATLALGEACGCYGISQKTGNAADGRLREALRNAVRLLENTQTKDGGWYYEPEAGSGHEGSITITALQGLRSARQAGIDVSRDTINRAVWYVTHSQNPNGSFSYALRDRRTSPALTAAAIATLHSFGLSGDPKVEKAIREGMDYLERQDFEVEHQWYFYSLFYMAQALWFDRSPARPDRFQDWYVDLCQSLLPRQKPEGYWDDIEGRAGVADFGRIYATAFACLILEMPYQYLPILQR